MPPKSNGSGKRKRSKPPAAGSNKKKAKRPPPPPQPPKSLVKLLKSDSSVLKYFQSLQANLDADVQVWKSRARDYEQRNKELQSQVDQLKNKQDNHKKSGAGQEQSNDSDCDKQPKYRKQLPPSPQERSPKAIAPTREDNGSGDNVSLNKRDSTKKDSSNGNSKGCDTGNKVDGVPIDDSMFELASSSDESDDDCPDATEPKETNEADAQLERNVRAAFAVDSESSSDESDEANEEGLSDPPKIKDFGYEQSTAAFAVDSGSSSDESDQADKKGDRQRIDDAGPEQSRDSSDVDDLRDPTPKVQDLQVVISEEDKARFKLLQEAYFSLEQHGVALVEEQVAKPTSPTVTDHISTNNQNAYFELDDDQDTDPKALDTGEEKSQTRLIARTDEDVAADILWAIQNMSQAHLRDEESMKSIPPFITTQLVPICNMTFQDDCEDCCEGGDETKTDAPEGKSWRNHPVVKGKESIFRALIVIDTYCSAHLWSDSAWSRLFDTGICSRTGSEGPERSADLVLKKMSIGLKGRKALVRQFFQSLGHEIAVGWPVSDRTEQSGSNALRLEKGSTNDVESQKSDNETSTTQSSSPPWLLDSRIQNRLGALLERCVQAQMVVGFYLSENNSNQAVTLLWDYILSNVPGGSDLENTYPELAPTLSFVILECMLLPRMSMSLISKTESESLWELMFLGADRTDPAHNIAKRSLEAGFRLCGAIWNERQTLSRDPRIRDCSRVELAAFHRIMSGLFENETPTSVNSKDWAVQHTAMSNELCHEINGLAESSPKSLVNYATRLCYILQQSSPVPLTLRDDSFLFEAQCQATAELEVRRLQSYRKSIGTTAARSPLFEYKLREFRSQNQQRSLKELGQLLRGAATLADGWVILQAAETIINVLISSNAMEAEELPSLLSLLGEVSEKPLIRVITLKNRPDRMRAFCSQAMQQELSIVHAVAEIEEDSCAQSGEAQFLRFFGGLAFDGRGTWLDGTRQLAEAVGGRLDQLVSTRWRPHDLKPFDRGAPDEEKLVHMSPTERACAVSHIAAWKGALRSFRIVRQGDSTEPSTNICQPDLLKRLFHISGFAEGAALHSSNRSMPPSPVILILEDDAILDDRFTVKLRDVLRDLPRDFHYCSLGYSRPKTAPIVKFKKNVGIPTNLFYLTGYLISEAGAEFLLNSLPVVGPVDSWIGLKMTDNFDNVFGQNAGIGHTKKTAEPIPGKELCSILKFRAFCVMEPVCEQRIGMRNWREKDTDIEYSGNL